MKYFSDNYCKKIDSDLFKIDLFSYPIIFERIYQKAFSGRFALEKEV